MNVSYTSGLASQLQIKKIRGTSEYLGQRTARVLCKLAWVQPLRQLLYQSAQSFPSLQNSLVLPGNLFDNLKPLRQDTN